MWVNVKSTAGGTMNSVCRRVPIAQSARATPTSGKPDTLEVTHSTYSKREQTRGHGRHTTIDEQPFSSSIATDSHLGRWHLRIFRDFGSVQERTSSFYGPLRRCPCPSGTRVRSPTGNDHGGGRDCRALPRNQDLFGGRGTSHRAGGDLSCGKLREERRPVGHDRSPGLPVGRGAAGAGGPAGHRCRWTS